MTRAPDQFAPSWLPRQQRRHVDRALRKLFQRGVCSICGGPFKPGSSTAAGFDAHGKVVLAGECCISRVAKLFMLGLELSEQIAAAHQKAAVDEMFDIAKRHGGLGCPAEVNLRDSPWKKADCEW